MTPARPKRTRKIDFDAEKLSKLKMMAGLRIPMDKIAAILGMDVRELERAANKDNAVRSAIDLGRAESTGKTHQTLYNMATGQPAVTDKNGKVILAARPPDFQALKFWCQTQEGFKTADRLEITGANGGAIQSVVMGDQTLRQLFADPEAVALAKQLMHKTAAKAEDKE